MPSVYYRVSLPGAVAAQLRQALLTARSQGRLPIALAAAKYAEDELGYDPLAFGESRDYLPAADLRLRVAFPRPLRVEFGVHEPSKTVFLRRLALVR